MLHYFALFHQAEGCAAKYFAWVIALWIMKSEFDLFDHEDEANSSDDEEADIRKQNAILQNKLEEKEKEIVHLHNVIKNLKHIPSLQDVLLDLKTQVAQLDRVIFHLWIKFVT